MWGSGTHPRRQEQEQQVKSPPSCCSARLILLCVLIFQGGTTSVVFASLQQSLNNQNFGPLPAFAPRSQQARISVNEDDNDEDFIGTLLRQQEQVRRDILDRLRGGAADATMALDDEEDEEDDDEEDEEDDDEEEEYGVQATVDNDEEEDEEEEEEEEEEVAMDPKLSAAAISSAVKAEAKVRAAQVGQTKSKLSQTLAQDSKSSSRTKTKAAATLKKTSSSKRRSLVSVPYIVKACLNPITAFSMIKAYWASLFSLEYPPQVRTKISYDTHTHGCLVVCLYAYVFCVLSD